MDPTMLDVLRCPRTAQRLHLDAARVDTDGSVQYGRLSAQGFCYPIVAGIPILKPGTDHVVDLIRAERFHEATAAAVFADVDRSRALPLIEAAAPLRGVGRVAGAFAVRIRGRLLTSDVRRLFGDPPADNVVGDPIQMLFLEDRHPNEEGYNYFRYRFGSPRYLVSLALLDALAPVTRQVLDVGCGAGHLTWAMTQRQRPGTVMGVDPSFAQLVSATQRAPLAQFVCADGRNLPLRSGAFDRVLSSDVLPYVTEKRSAVAELIRVLATDGDLVVTALRNALQQHVYGGESLTPQAWLDLFDPLGHRWLVADDAVLDRYLDGRAPGGLTDNGADASQTVSIVASRRAPNLDSGEWEAWPHARGPLAPHPLLFPSGTDLSGTVFERRFPSQTYARDNSRITDYLPKRCVVPTSVLRHANSPTARYDTADDAVVQGLIATVALLALPDPERQFVPPME